MKVNLNVPLLDLDGKPSLDEFGKSISLKESCANALIAIKRDGSVGLNEEDSLKLTKFNLALKINAAKEEIELTPEEVVMIKQAVNSFNGPLVYGRVCEILK